MCLVAGIYAAEHIDSGWGNSSVQNSAFDISLRQTHMTTIQHFFHWSSCRNQVMYSNPIATTLFLSDFFSCSYTSIKLNLITLAGLHSETIRFGKCYQCVLKSITCRWRLVAPQIRAKTCIWLWTWFSAWTSGSNFMLFSQLLLKLHAAKYFCVIIPLVVHAIGHYSLRHTVPQTLVDLLSGDDLPTNKMKHILAKCTDLQHGAKTSLSFSRPFNADRILGFRPTS